MSASADPWAVGADRGIDWLMMRTRDAASLAAAAVMAWAFAGPAPGWAQDSVASTPASTQPAAPNALAEGVVAVVNDNIISSYDLQQRVRLLVVTSGVRPTQDNMPQIAQAALQQLIDERLEMQEIRHQEKEQKFHIVADDNDVAQSLERLAAGNQMTGAQLLGALASSGIGADTLREQLRTQISWQRWIQGRYGGSRLRIGQEQISATLRQVEAETEKPQYQVAEIFLDAKRAGGMDQAMNGAQQLVNQLQQGAPFAAVARQFSAAPTAANGGDAGWLSESQLKPEVRDVLTQMHPGELSRPIPVDGGVYIMALKDKRSGAGAEMVTLKQAAIALPAGATADQVAAATRKLAALKLQITSCDDLIAKSGKVDGVVADDLGEADVSGLRPEFRDAVGTLQPGEISNPIRTNVGVHLVAVCGKRRGGITLPTRDEVESHLEDQQLSLIARRYLRDLHSSATIDYRQ